MLKDNLEYIRKINYFIIFNVFNPHIDNILSYLFHSYIFSANHISLFMVALLRFPSIYFYF